LSNEYTCHEPLQSVERTFTILELLAKKPQGLYLTEISEKVGLSSSTVHRLLHSLMSLRYVLNRKESGGKYKLSYKLYELGTKYVAGQPFIQAAFPFLEKLSSNIFRAVSLYVPELFDVVSVARTGNGREKATGHLPALRVPMYACSAGIAILSTYDNERIEALWENSKVMPLTPCTMKTLGRLYARVESARERGYDLSQDEYRMGVSNMAVAIVPRGKTAIGAIQCVYPSSEGQSAVLKDSATLLETAKALADLYSGVL
jgi:DNA-binding IclR family transcriptional regulator